jgi:tetratricopeptide (TPR) repeat protein
MNDKLNRIIQQRIAELKPETIEDLQKILDSFIGKTLEQLEFHTETDEDKALELVWEANRLPIDKGRRLAQKALKMDPDCLEAYEYLGNSYSYYDKRRPYFEKAVEIGRRRFGGDFLKENKGAFWMMSETRSYMRCLLGLAECLFALLQTKHAVEIWKEMLDLNPNDNQGVRYILMPILVETKDFATYKKIRKKYKEASPMLLYSDALAAFAENGDTPKTNKLLRSAILSNRFVPPLLLATYPPDALPDTYQRNSKEEALIYVSSAWRGWYHDTTPGAKEWLQYEWRKMQIGNT